jgi:hypothetical protein
MEVAAGKPETSTSLLKKKRPLVKKLYKRKFGIEDYILFNAEKSRAHVSLPQVVR